MTFEIINKDCIEAMREFKDDYFDAIVTDPPYGTTEEGKSKVTMSGDEVVEFGMDWDRVLPVDWIPHAFRVLKPGGSIIAWTDCKATTILWREFEKSGIHPLQCVYWKKMNGPSNPRKNFCSSVEAAVFGRKPGKVIAWNGGGSTKNIIDSPIVLTDRIHPTQKPLKVMRWCVTLVSPADGVILDPFCGSGTTGVACVERGMNFVGIEIDKRYADAARKRVDEFSKQMVLI